MLKQAVDEAPPETQVPTGEQTKRTKSKQDASTKCTLTHTNTQTAHRTLDQSKHKTAKGVLNTGQHHQFATATEANGAASETTKPTSAPCDPPKSGTMCATWGTSYGGHGIC